MASAGHESDKVISLKLTNRKSGVLWRAEERTTREVFYDLPWPFQWSENGRDFYFTHRPAISDGCFGFDDSNGSDMWRVDLSTGKVREIAPKVGGWLALSPDEETLAYISGRPDQIVLRDLESNNERSRDIDLTGEYEGVTLLGSHLLWSPDGNALVFTMETSVCGIIPESPTHSIVLIAADTLSQRPLIREDKRLFTTVEWSTVGVILLKDKDGNLWRMSVENGQVTKSQ